MWGGDIQFYAGIDYTFCRIIYAIGNLVPGAVFYFVKCYICNMSTANKTIHEGRNVKRFREMLGMKQETLAAALGEDWNQKKISLLEAKELIETPILEDVAKALQVPVEAIKNLDEESAINIISNTFTDNQFAGYTVNNNPNFNPLDKYVEQVEEIKTLYAALLKEKDEKIALLERLLQKQQ